MNGYLSDRIVPSWYELSFVPPSKIHLKIHRVALIGINRGVDLREVPMTKHLMERFQLKTFTPPHEGNCGFDNVFTLVPTDHSDWIVWEIRLPKIKCLNGQNEDNHKYIIALRASLYLISTGLWLFGSDECGEKSNWPEPQLMIIEGICLPSIERSFGDGSLSVTFSPAFIRWLKEAGFKDNSHLKEVVDSMIQAYQFMWEGNSFGRFGALFRLPKWLNLDVPGNACGLDPDGYSNEYSPDGYTLQPHNIDSSLQQLTFLAGIAKLHDLAKTKL